MSRKKMTIVQTVVCITTTLLFLPVAALLLVFVYIGRGADWLFDWINYNLPRLYRLIAIITLTKGVDEWYRWLYQWEIDWIC